MMQLPLWLALLGSIPHPDLGTRPREFVADDPTSAVKSRTVELPAIRCTYSDLIPTMAEAFNAFGPSSPKVVQRIDVEFGEDSGARKVSFNRIPSESELAAITFVSTEVDIRILGSDDRDVGRVVIFLRPTRRTIEVSGQSLVRVEGTALLLQDRLERYHYFLGDSWFHSLVAMVGCPLAFFSVLVIMRTRPRLGLLLMVIVATAVVPAVYALGNGTLLGGVHVVDKSPAWFEQYAALLAVIGLVSLLPLGAIRSWMVGKRSHK